MYTSEVLIACLVTRQHEHVFVYSFWNSYSKKNKRTRVRQHKLCYRAHLVLLSLRSPKNKIFYFINKIYFFLKKI